MRWSALLLVLALSSLSLAQENKLQAELRREGERASDACSFSFKSIPTCAYTLFTDHPLHIAAGSMPPQNGFGLGGAFVWSKNTHNWRMSWDGDAVGAFSGAWRAGAYMQMVHTPHPAKPQIKVLPATGAGPSDGGETLDTQNFTHPYTVLNFYAQTISLNKLFFFGEGNDRTTLGKSVFGMKETIIGANVIKPVYEWPAIRGLHLSLFGEMNGRFVDIRGNHDESSPSIELLYDNTSAPGLSDHRGFLQFTEGLRIKPVIADRLQLNYMANFQQYVAPSNSDFSFLRWTIDLNHIFYLYGYTESAAKTTDGVGPDECAPGAGACPTVSRSRNLNGSISFRLLLSESITSASSVVPFYFQPTLGGLDINGSPALPSYEDYRFRAPNVFLLQEKFEHSIWGPLGFSFNADQGKVALTRGDIGFNHLKHSFATGITLRAGGFPMVYLLYAWGGNEGQHTIGSMNTSLLGGSARPSLF